MTKFLYTPVGAAQKFLWKRIVSIHPNSEQKHPKLTFVSLKHRLKEHVTFLNETLVNKTFQLRFFLEKKHYLSINISELY